ncbi:hypothetical protein [Pseudoalteromonas tunicata]|jgi:hypothetical protein|uniref:Outer membrane lipoprotein n=1 Tax=Pseudoalteromonas tunicata D2 TaxID=87626 RepID=A4C702_9GAMM|nr:hypothetical protein [Pseudoalteromonas tunicata]ATC95726.1 hypothetical protein PTUN_a3386 [Pseudoalteromonas tunicata]AXT31281.1 hypothetical protein D1819_10985 [Pseudoalteromonas tunicata]EAR29756.1 hypothetical protein PTD2_13089 [Pseudoalteromonas tunicata D2]MDP4985662.1 hypothetical protein [Pseudoalteromonas tunicata]MDP5213993.1 hypothetical protein [Pseudoalteromonas tunicata]
MKKSLPLLLMVSWLAGCANQGIDRADQNKVIKQYYARVDSIAHVKLDSDVPEAMAIGGATGLIKNLDGDSGDMIAGTIVGAFFTGIISAAFEGDNNAYQYQLSSVTQGNFSVVQKDKSIKPGECVLVKEASKVTLTKIPEHFCQQTPPESSL